MGKANSQTSVGSTKSNRYRPVAPNSYVDETLFAGPSKEAVRAKGAAKAAGSPEAAKAVAAGRSAVTIKAEDLERMMKGPATMTAEAVAQAKAATDAKKAAERAAAQAKIETMMRLAEEARKHIPATETELIKAGKDKGMLSRATFLMDEQRDDVKFMNQKVLYSKCVTVRDAQVLEKKHLMQEDEEYNKRMDLMMETERLKAIGKAEEREALRRLERLRGGAVIKEQLAEREAERARQKEIKEQEGVMLKRELERLKHEEDAAKARKAAELSVMMAEVAATNSEQIKRKELMKVREQEEDARIADYVRQKDLKEQAAAEEKAAADAAKELEMAKQRAAQKKNADKAAMADELRARRYQEAKERDARAREASEAEAKAAIVAEIAAGREAQKLAKLRLQADMAEREYGEFMRVLEVNKKREAEEDALEEAKHTVRLAVKGQVQAQIAAKEESVRAAREAKFEEGRQLKGRMAAEKARLQDIKERKLAELEAAGVPAKYRVELAMTKIMPRG